MKKKIKKAFTLVELLVVIAILAILATVSIVGYNSFTKKAKVSNDTVLVKQMNDVLFADSQVDGKNNTMTDALDDVLDGGYDLDKLTPTTTNYNIVWDSANDQMVLLDEEMKVVYPSDVTVNDTNKHTFFTLVDNESEITNTASFSHYLKDGFTTTNGKITTTTGIDVGKNTNIDSITYNQTSNNTQNVIINTNGGSLVVDAENDTVNHYGKLDGVEITNVAQDSYHEFGNVNGNVVITKGHLVLENTASVGTIKVSETAVANEVKVSNNSTDSIVFIDADNKLSSDSNIGSTSITVTDKDAVALIGNTSYKTINDSLTAAKDGDIIKLIADYRIPDSVADTAADRITINKKITLDFGNYHLIGVAKMSGYSNNFSVLYVDEDTTFAAEENGGIICENDESGIGPYGVNVRKGAKLIVKSGTYFGGGTSIQVHEGTLEILGGTFEATPYDEPYGYKYVINCIDANFKNGTAKIIIKGGSFYKFDPADSKSENPNGEFTADGYRVNSIDDWYFVIPE